MSSPTTFVNKVSTLSAQLIALMGQIQDAIDQNTGDNTLIPTYFATPGHRTDIVAQDVTNALGALGQIEFALASGNPTQKTLLFKVLP